MPIIEHGNLVSVKGGFSPRELRYFCATLYQLISEKKWEEIILDFSQCQSASEQVMLPLMPIIVQYREKQKIDFKLHEPDLEPLRRLFVNANWGYYINPEKHDRKHVPYEGAHVPATQYEDSSSQHDLHEKVMNLVFGNLEVTKNNIKVVEWSLWEIMDNVLNHAESSVGGFVQATAFLEKNKVEFVVADAGMGIPVSMNEQDNSKALRDAVSEGITKDKNNNAGNGLYGSCQAAVISEGQFEIHSLNGHLFQNNIENKIHNNSIPYKGTSVRCAIGLSDPKLLSKALRFKDAPHDPHSPYLEKFENKNEEVIFRMKTKAGRAFGSRTGGKHVRKMIDNLLREREVIVLDFEGVGIISSSFADEVFGRLFVNMGFRTFTRRIEMRNVDPIVDGLIDRAIEQRTKLGNGASESSS